MGVGVWAGPGSLDAVLPSVKETKSYCQLNFLLGLNTFLHSTKSLGCRKVIYEPTV